LIDSNLTYLGTIQSTHGLDGFLKTQIDYSFLSKIPKPIPVTISSKIFRIQTIKKSGPKTLLQFEGFESIDKAKELVNYEIFISKDLLPPKDNSEFYPFELEGLCVTQLGRLNGYEVRRVWNNGASWILTCGMEEKSINIPFLKSVVGEIDSQANTIEIFDWDTWKEFET
jgi:16S rRNA processing protein RimM